MSSLLRRRRRRRDRHPHAEYQDAEEQVVVAERLRLRRRAPAVVVLGQAEVDPLVELEPLMTGRKQRPSGYLNLGSGYGKTHIYARLVEPNHLVVKELLQL